MSIHITKDVRKNTTDDDQIALGSFYAYTVNNPERDKKLVKYAPINEPSVNNIYKDIENVPLNPNTIDITVDPKVKSKKNINGKNYQLDMAYSDKDGTDVQVWTNTDSGESIFVAQGS